MERVHVPLSGRKALRDDINSELVGGRNNGASGFTLGEELFLGDLARLGVMAYEDDLHLVVFGLQKPHHPKVKRTGYILLELTHGSRYVHHRDDNGVGFIGDLFFPCLVAQIFFFERAEIGLAAFTSTPPDVLNHAAALVQVCEDARTANLGKLGGLGRNCVFGLFFKIRQVKILEDQRGDLIDIDLGFIVFLARLCASPGAAAGPLTARVAFASDDITDFCVSLAGAYMLLLAIIESEFVLVPTANRHLHDASAVGKNYRFIRDNGAEVLLDRFTHSLLVTLLIDLSLALKRPIVSCYGHAIPNLFAVGLAAPCEHGMEPAAGLKLSATAACPRNSAARWRTRCNSRVGKRAGPAPH